VIRPWSDQPLLLPHFVVGLVIRKRIDSPRALNLLLNTCHAELLLVTTLCSKRTGKKLKLRNVAMLPAELLRLILICMSAGEAEQLLIFLCKIYSSDSQKACIKVNFVIRCVKYYSAQNRLNSFLVFSHILINVFELGMPVLPTIQSITY